MIIPLLLRPSCGQRRLSGGVVSTTLWYETTGYQAFRRRRLAGSTQFAKRAKAGIGDQSE
jgi:hypothetical protein